MVRTISRKTYPLLPWCIGLAVIIAIVGVVMSGLVTNPSGADVMTLVIALVVAAVVAFAALLYRRKEVYEVTLPTDRLAEANRSELQGILQGLDEAKAKGEIPEERYQKAKAKILAEMGTGKPAKK